MPMYLKRDTIRLLEASVEAISLAVTSLGLPQRHLFREDVAQNSISIGSVTVTASAALSPSLPPPLPEPLLPPHAVIANVIATVRNNAANFLKFLIFFSLPVFLLFFIF